MLIFGKITTGWVFVCLYHLLLGSQFMVRKLEFWKRVAFYAGGCILLSVAGIWTDSILVLSLVCSAAAGISCWFESDASPIQALCFGLLFGLLRLCSWGLVLFLQQVFPDSSEACSLMMDILLLFALSVCLSAFGQRWRATATPLLWLIPLWLAAVIRCGLAIHFSGSSLALAPELFGFAWLLYAGVRVIQTCVIIDKQAFNYLKKQQAVRHYAQQEDYYQQLLVKQAETRALWHDLNKYLRAAKAEAPPTQALAQLEVLLDSATGIVDVGNQVVNVILNEYNQAASAAGIELRLKVQVPEDLFVSAADLYVLIGNTLDNALEACKELPGHQRLIDLTLRIHNDVLFYKLVNPYSESAAPGLKDPTRGFGLQNVRRCVDAYKGVLDVVKRDGYFTVSAHLNRP